MIDFDKLFEDFSKVKVAIVGDVMLDTYWWGKVERISPEAPVPVVAISHRELRIGGAANVALNTVSLGASTTIFSVIGNDEDGKCLKRLLEENNINCSYIVESNSRITTNKIRIISRNQHMMRLDAELTKDIEAHEEQALISRFRLFLEQEAPTVVIFEDYNKGVLTANVIETLIGVCNGQGIVTTVDPKKKNFFCYRGVNMFKPNLKEVKEALNTTIDKVAVGSLSSIHEQLKAKLGHAISLITLSEHGVFFNDEDNANIIPTYIRNIADVSGAGDTVIAVASIVYALQKNIALAAAMANVAGGIVCEEVGTVAIKKDKLLQECKELLLSEVL